MKRMMNAVALHVYEYARCQFVRDRLQTYRHSAAKIMRRTWPKSKQLAMPSAKQRIMLRMPALIEPC